MHLLIDLLDLFLRCLGLLEGGRDFAAREYHPTQGRWVTPDPAGLRAVNLADPQTWNRYAYVRNNPLNRIDPYGFCPPGTKPSEQEPCFDGVPKGFRDTFSGGNCYFGDLQSDCAVLGGALHAGVAIQCPNNACTTFGPDPYTGTPTYLQFTFGGGAAGYLSAYDWTEGVNAVKGTFMSNAQYNQYILSVYAGDINAQRVALAAAYAANSGGRISYQQGYDLLDPAGGHLQGGNYNFVVNMSGILIPFNVSCGGDLRCNGIHFPSDGYVHLDTTNPWGGPANLFQHAWVDVILGNIFYTVIPRPSP